MEEQQKKELARLMEENELMLRALHMMQSTPPQVYGYLLHNAPRHKSAKGRRVWRTNNYPRKGIGFYKPQINERVYI